MKNADPEYVEELTELKREALAEIPQALGPQSRLRKISLRRIEEAVVEALTNKRPIPDAIQYLGGLTRIRYVFVYPNERDIALAGPSESWMIDANGGVVGTRTRKPVLRLEDLLIALRSVEDARIEPISCSIDSSPEGVRRFRAFMRSNDGFLRQSLPASRRVSARMQ